MNENILSLLNSSLLEDVEMGIALLEDEDIISYKEKLDNKYWQGCVPELDIFYRKDRKHVSYFIITFNPPFVRAGKEIWYR